LAQIEFWYEFASPYSYLSAMRVEARAQLRGIEDLGGEERRHVARRNA
jgi:2-hydroxychromene-2-carboxylate isomerase